MSTNATIHTGFWTNFSKGPVLGSTLTLGNRNAAVLIAFLAIFLQFAGIGSWSIMCFIAHQMRTTTQVKDGLYHQQQATLRNATSDFGTLWQFTKLGFAWRSRSLGFRRSLSPVLIGAFHVIAFGAASILSSHITSVGSQVLVAQSQYCGDWTLPGGGSNASAEPIENGYLSYVRTTMSASQYYVQACLDGSQLPECNVFKSPKLDWTSRNVPCPFDGLCLGSGVQNSLYMDTGLIDSRDDLGINGRNADRVQIRRNMTCVPVQPKGYMVEGSTSIDFPGYFSSGSSGNMSVNYTAAFYGPMFPPHFPTLGLNDKSLSNATYIYINFREAATQLWNMEKSPYDVHVVSNYKRDFTPLHEFNAINRTLTLVLVSIAGIFSAPSDDPWLSAHKNVTVHETSDIGSYEAQVFYPDNKLSAVACTEQAQICNPFPRSNNKSICTPWMSSQVNKTAERKMFATVLDTDRQQSIAFAMRRASEFGDINGLVQGLPSPLLADALSYANQASPAPDQWALEARNWFAIGLASMQRYFNDYVAGPPSQFSEFKYPPNQAEGDQSLNWLCQSLVARRDDFTNFSTLAISLIFGLGLLIMVTSMFLESLVGWFRLRFGGSTWIQRAWWVEGTLQLQRRAFEAMGIKDWESGDWDSIPLASKSNVWNSFQGWDNTNSISAGNNKAGDLESELSQMTSSDDSQRSGGRTNSPSSVKPKEFRRLRSYSV